MLPGEWDWRRAVTRRGSVRPPDRAFGAAAGVGINWKSVLGMVDRRDSRNMLAATTMTRRRSESRMPNEVPGNQSPARSVRLAGPIISAYDG